MITLPRFIRTLRRDERGGTIVEFAMICIPLCIILLGFVDLGYRSYVTSIIQGALHEASRMATVGDKTEAQIDAHVNKRLVVFSNNATITITKKGYEDFSSVKKAEPMTTDNAPLNVVDSGDCWRDYVVNGEHDTDRGKSGLGGGDDVILYEVSMTFPRVVPLGKLLGWSSDQNIKASTVLRNQPFAAQVKGAAIACKA